MRICLKMFAAFVLVFFIVVPYARAQFESGCCNQFAEQTLNCSNTKPPCSHQVGQYFCRVYAGEGVTGITAVAGGVLCCNKIYPQLFSNGFCVGGDAPVSAAVVERHQRLAYVRNCSGAYELALLPVSVTSLPEPASPRRVSHETAAAPK